MTTKSRNPERDAKIVDDYLAGKSQAAIAAEHGLHFTRIYQILKREGLLKPAKSEPAP